MEVTSAEALLPPSTEGEEKRTSWVNENFDDDAPCDEGVKGIASQEEKDVSPYRDDIPAATTAMSTVVAGVGGEVRDLEPAILTPSGGERDALLEVDISPQSEVSNGKVTSHRPLPSPSQVRAKGGGGSVRLKHATLRPLNESSQYDLQVSITEREKHTASKTDAFIIYKIETKVLL